MWRFVVLSTFVAIGFVDASRVKKDHVEKTDLKRVRPHAGVDGTLPTKLTDDERMTSRTSVSFIKGLLQMKGNNYVDTFCSRSKDNCTTVDGFPGSNSHSELTFDVIVRELMETPKREEEGTIRRLGDLGYFIFNDLLWDKDWKVFPIGADFEDHRMHRPTADKLMGHNSGAWSPELIREHVKEFFKGRNSMKGTDYDKFSTKLFHKILLDMTLSDIEIEDFESYKGSSMMVAMLPRWLVTALKWKGTLSTAQENRDLWLEKYEAAMEKDTRKIIPEMTDPRDRRFLADLLLTACTSAGGISVPSIMGLALAVVYGGDKSPLPEDQRQLTKKTIRPLVYETVRRYAVVVGFPWWSPDMSKRTVLNLAVGLRDPRKWTEPEAFKLRDINEYHEKAGSGTKIGIAWAQQGKGPEGVTPDSRGCPGQELSVVIVEEFLKELMPMQNEWSVTEMGKDGVTISEGPSGASPFTLSKGATGESTIRDEPEQTGPKTVEEEAEMAASSVGSTATFQCPSQCMECCQQVISWSFVLGRQDKTAFKCVMPKESIPGFKIVGRKCDAATPRDTDPPSGESKCALTTAEQAHEFQNQLAICN